MFNTLHAPFVADAFKSWSPLPFEPPFSGFLTKLKCWDFLLLLVLSHFSCVWLCVTPEMAAHQAPLSLGFSRQEHWSGLPFLLQCMKVKSESEVTQLCPTLRDSMDCSLPGCSIHRIFQARVLEWGAIAFSAQNPYLVANKECFLSSA